jgi:hypothetical protein
MAVTHGVGHSRVLEKRRFEDYKSLKQYYQNSNLEEVIISGTTTSDGALAEICFCDNVIDYAGSAGQAYIRTEQDDQATQGNKYVYLQYQDSTGAVQDWVTADLDNTNTTTEVAIGSTDFYRARQMYSEVVSSANDAIILCDADWGGADDTYAEIRDGESKFSLERFFTQPDSTHISYLAYIKLHVPEMDHDGAASGHIFSVTYTPKPLNGGEAQVAAAITEEFYFSRELIFEPCYELDGGTEVIFKVGDVDSAGVIHLEAVLVEVLL